MKMTMTMSQSHPADIEVTPGLLAVVQAIRKAGAFFLAESNVADHFHLSPPLDYFKRCEYLFYKTYGQQAKQVGMSLNQVTFEGIIRCELPNDVLHTPDEDLPNLWVFNPYRGWRQAGSETDRERQRG